MQIIVYAGAIMVLFLFVIMLLGVDRQESLRERLVGQRWLALALGAGLIAEVIAAVHLGIGLSNGGVPDFAAALNAGGNVAALARVLFGPYFFPFEVTSVLLIVAAIGIDAARTPARRPARRSTRTPAQPSDAGAAEPATRGGRRRREDADRYYLSSPAVLFTIGTVGVLVRRNALVIFMSIELQLNAVNLALVAFSRMHGSLTGRRSRSS